MYVRILPYYRQADINAAVSIANRPNLGGEIGRMKSDRNDSLRDGSTGDSTTGCQHTS